jgi:hypothetical protein
VSATGQGGEAAQQTQTNGGAGEGGGEAQQAAPDFGALSEQLQQLAGGQEELRQFLATNPWQAQETQQQQQEQAPASPEVDLSWLDPADPGYDPEQMSQRLTETFGQYVQQATEQATAPVMEQMQDMQREQAAERLVNEFPDLRNEETANEVVRASHEYASALGMPQLGNDPGFWRLVYLSGRAIDAAQQEGSGDPGAAHLEGGGGAIPGGPQVDTRADEIMNAGGKRGASVLPYH